MTLINTTEVLTVDTVEHELLSWGPVGDSKLILKRLFLSLTCCLILGTNIPVVAFIINRRPKIFLDWLILFDCFLCLSDCIGILGMNFDHLGVFCNFYVFFEYFKNLNNRLLTVGIAIYRFILVVGSSLVWTKYQRRVFERLIFNSILFFTLYMTGLAVYYRDNYKMFLGNNKSSYFRVKSSSKELNLGCKLNQTWARPDLDLT